MQVVVVLMFLIAIILYRTIVRIIIYKSGNNFVSDSVSTTAALGLFPEGLHRLLTSHFCYCFFKVCFLPVCCQSGRIASITGSVLNLLVILMLSKVYTSLADILTRWGESNPLHRSSQPQFKPFTAQNYFKTVLIFNEQKDTL